MNVVLSGLHVSALSKHKILSKAQRSLCCNDLIRISIVYSFSCTKISVHKGSTDKNLKRQTRENHPLCHTNYFSSYILFVCQQSNESLVVDNLNSAIK